MFDCLNDHPVGPPNALGISRSVVRDHARCRLHAMSGRLLQRLVRELSRPTEHRDDFNDMNFTSVHDPEPAGDDFAYLRRLTFWNHSPGVRKRLQTLDCGQYPLCCQVRVGTRVKRDVRPNLFNVGKSLRRPSQLGHSPSRRFASSWEMPSPRSSCARPISIFARNTRRSIASSTVALAGSSRMASTIRSLVIGAVMMPRF